MNINENNPSCIPNLDPMYEKIRDFVLAHQGNKGFICLDDSRCDTIWTMVFMDYEMEYREFEVKAIRVKNGHIQIMYDPPQVKYSDESIKDMDDDCWFDIKYDSYIYYLPTIFSIAENISEYVDDDTGRETSARV